jgi:alcohol dehydrogenase (cytochrome c)
MKISMTRKQFYLSGFVAFTCLVSTAALAGPIENYSPVTSQRLENPEPGNWMLYRRTYDGHGYSPLDQINASNV